MNDNCDKNIFHRHSLRNCNVNERDFARRFHEMTSILKWSKKEMFSFGATLEVGKSRKLNKFTKVVVTFKIFFYIIYIWKGIIFCSFLYKTIEF